jgi:cyclopropane fatty-acyl-phospholipid synthase-like methyltransferase
MASRTRGNGKAAAKPRFRERFEAWWQGREPVASAAQAPAKQDGIRVVASNDKPAFAPPDRIAAMQVLWGAGFCGPGNAEFVVHIAKPLRLNSQMSLLDMGSGLGGPAREIAKAFGIWVTGYETSRDIVAAGIELATKVGMEKKATLTPFDPDVVELPERKYDRILSRELLSAVKDKAPLLNKMTLSMRPKGEMLVTDFVAGDAPDAAKKIKAWLAREPAPRHILTPQEMVDALKVCGLDVPVADDMTDVYLAQIAESLRGLEKAVRTDRTVALSEHLMRETAIWLERADMLHSKVLRMYRFHALKANAPKPMSDW